jgi:large conductance mechanosensitive channel
MRGFRDFLARGNVVDLAVAVVIGAAFGAVVTALVTDFITPLIAALGGKPNFSQLSFTVNHSKFLYGAFINALLSFLVIAAVVFYFVVLPYGHLMARFHPETPPAPTKACPYCLSSIPQSAQKCAFCTADLNV